MPSYTLLDTARRGGSGLQAASAGAQESAGWRAVFESNARRSFITRRLALAPTRPPDNPHLRPTKFSLRTQKAAGLVNQAGGSGSGVVIGGGGGRGGFAVRVGP